MEAQDKLTRFEQCMIPHMDAAYNLALWLTRNPEQAEDVVQDAYLRAFKFFDGFRGGNSRSWLLRIVRSAFYDSIRRERHEPAVATQETEAERLPDPWPHPDAALLQKADEELVRRAIEALPLEYREIILMRELENFSYREIAEIASLPLGTVMSRLARARERLRKYLADELEGRR